MLDEVKAQRITSTEVINWFLPSDASVTQSLVGLSGLNRLREFSQMATYLAFQADFKRLRRLVLGTLKQLDEEPSDVLFRRLASPIFRGWLSRFGGVQEYVKQDGVLRAQLKLWNNMRYSLIGTGDFRETMQVIEGCCMTWDPRLAIRVGALDQVLVMREGRRLRVWTTGEKQLLFDADIHQEGLITSRFAAKGCSLLEAPQLPESEIVVRNDLPLLHLKLSRTAQREDGVVFGASDHSPESYGSFEPEPFREAASILAHVWPEEYSDFRKTLQVVVPRDAPPGWRARGMTVSSHQGAIWIFVRDILDLVEHMVHEQSHVKLRYIEEACPLLVPGQTDQRFSVPWRKDPRPIVGIYEGVYVHLHVLLALIACLRDRAFRPDILDLCAARIEGLSGEVEEGLRILLEHAQFTESGYGFSDWAGRSLAEIRAIMN